MCAVASPPPCSPVHPVIDTLHGISISDPYRWLEDQDSLRTRAWIEEQRRYARSHLDALPGRARIRERVRELLDVETCDSFLKAGERYFFRKRLLGQEQPSIYFREGVDGEDHLLIDPVTRGTGDYTAVKPLRASTDGSLLLYEVKHGGERTATFEFFDVSTRTVLRDKLPRGHFRGFVFGADSQGFYYAHELPNERHERERASFYHRLGTDFEEDFEIFRAHGQPGLTLSLIGDRTYLGFLVYQILEQRTYTDFYVWRIGELSPPCCVLRNAEYIFSPVFVGDRILALTDFGAPNRRIVELSYRGAANPQIIDLVPAGPWLIERWAVIGTRIYISYAEGSRTNIRVVSLSGAGIGNIPSGEGETIRLATGHSTEEVALFQRESFTEPPSILRYDTNGCRSVCFQPHSPMPRNDYGNVQLSFPSIDGTQVPITLVGRRDALASERCPTIMTSYGGYGVSMKPQFSALVAFLLERGCVFAMPGIRGGAERGAEWHLAARRHNRQVSIDDFLAAAEWLIATHRTASEYLAIFGGSNSGLLVAAALTQRPELFCAVLCMVPIVDMLRFHLFDDSLVSKGEFGTAEDPEDFAALYRYSPYHRVCDGVAYPATMIVSGDLDGNCNPLHARKMTARLQAANSSDHPVILDYHPLRGHSPVLPLGIRVGALTDRLAFLCNQLGVKP